ncbi:glycoside hydrolase family 36 protein [Caldifermentibacillus hisashii]|uniref:glycoside hydrolase family 36 protein n=1 Tax=Caldifermentibacillus hisashii TaxID=996558 RepID=UPI0031B7ACC8
MNLKKIYKHTFGSTNIVFVLTEENRLRLVQFSKFPYVDIENLDLDLVEASNLVELQVTGMDQPNHKGNKLGYTLLGRDLELEEFKKENNTLIILQRYQYEEIKIRVKTIIEYIFDTDVFRWKNVVENNGKTIGIEYISSINITNLNQGHSFQKYIDNILYLPHNSWTGELQWQQDNLKNYGLDFQLDGEKLQDSTKVISITNNSSWSCSQFSPMAVLYNPLLEVSSFWQIENNGEWHWELSDCGLGKYLVLRGFGPTEPNNHWWKSLENGESFETVTVAYGTVYGGFNESVNALTNYRRAIRRKNEDNEKCPVIFNDYMNCLMGEPTTEKEIPLIDKAAEVGCEYYVIDCGWYSEGYWWDNVGEWLPSNKRFPEGIEFLTKYIREKGMIPGLWLEIEVMGVNNQFANSLPDDWFICRHGERVKDHSRYHLDFRNPNVRRYATSVVDRLIEKYDIGYIKMDYNTPTGIGSDINANSFSDALLQHNRAYIKWLDELFQKYPDLIIENCGSGGMRHDYIMLARHSIQSVTDQTDYLRNGAIAAICASAITPEQAAIWSYPLKEGDIEEVIFNMINSMLLRIHQSGHLAELSTERLNLVKEGIDVYKEIRKKIPISIPQWYSGIPKIDDEWFSFSLKCEREIYLAVWRTNSEKDQFSIKIPHEIMNVEQIYPKELNSDALYDYSKNAIRMNYKHNKMARLYRITV